MLVAAEPSASAEVRKADPGIAFDQRDFSGEPPRAFSMSRLDRSVVLAEHSLAVELANNAQDERFP